MTLYLLFDANLVQKRPSCTQVQTLICGIYKIKFWIQLLRVFVLSYSTDSDTYLHILILSAYAHVTFPVNKNHVVGSCKNTITYFFKVAWRRQIHLSQKDRHYDYSLKCYIFALFL